MKKIPYCVPEIIETVLSTAKNVSDKLFIHKKVINTVIDKIASLEELGDSPYELMRICLRSAYKALGATDPYEQKKQEFSRDVQGLQGYFGEYIKNFGDELEASINIAAALNYEGLCACSLSGRSIGKRICSLLESEDISQESIKEFERVTKNAETVLYIIDSVGEIIGDKYLIEVLSRDYTVTVVVAPQPILFRATAEDALACGLDKFAALVDPGADMYGVNLEKVSSEFRKLFKESDVAIIKGGVNARTLANCGRDYFILGAGYTTENIAGEIEVRKDSTMLRKFIKYIEA